MAPAKKNYRMARYRDKLKNDDLKWQQHLEKERARDRKRREAFKNKLEENDMLKEEQRKRILSRLKKCREKKMQVQSLSIPETSPIGSYKCKQSFGKAVNRLKKILPDSPTKKNAVIKKLAVDVGLKLTEPNPQRTGPRALLENEVEAIKSFYCSDPISRQAPGKLDTKTIKCPKTGKRSKLQVRHLIMTICEAYEEFKKSHPNIIVGKSTFFSLRPQHILPVSKMPHNVCVCKYHANVNFLTESISKIDSTFPKNHKGLLQKLCCDVNKEHCTYENCSGCSKNTVTNMTQAGIDINKLITWKQWVDEKGASGIQLKVFSGTLWEVIQDLDSKMPHFKKHCFIKKVQEQSFMDKIKVLKEKSDETYAVMQIDFAENYSITYQDEIQAAHWSHQQVALFTCCVWLPNGNIKSYVVISDETSHSKYCVYTFLRKILRDVKYQQVSINYPKIDQVMIFSDNCAGQFKSRFTISTLCKLQVELELDVEWNFFSSSHGKGAVDGIGATVKHNVWVSVKGNREVHIAIVNDFYEHVRKNVSGITSFYMDKDTVAENKPVLNELWETVLKIPAIRECHYFKVYDSTNILVSRTCQSLMEKIPMFEQNESSEEDFDKELITSRFKTRLQYEDVYSDDEPEKDAMSSEPVDSGDIYSGLYVLVNVPSQQSRGQKIKEGRMNRYAAICQSQVDSDGFVSVMFLKSHSDSKTVFIADNNDITDVKFDNVIGTMINIRVTSNRPTILCIISIKTQYRNVTLLSNMYCNLLSCIY